jgi:hypothetical protein
MTDTSEVDAWVGNPRWPLIPQVDERFEAVTPRGCDPGARSRPSDLDERVRSRSARGVGPPVARRTYFRWSAVTMRQKLSLRSGASCWTGSGTGAWRATHTSQTRYSSGRAPQGRITSCWQRKHDMPVGVSLRVVIIAGS